MYIVTYTKQASKNVTFIYRVANSKHNSITNSVNYKLNEPQMYKYKIISNRLQSLQEIILKINNCNNLYKP